ncbi:MAG: Hpt domain-containing protein [Gammaproteobacteria bacterium]
MAMHNDIDAGALRWVKQEIDETLSQARHALEEYVENPEDATQLRFCATYIHQVYGTLQMVELYGAALLAEEMEHLAQALTDDEAEGKQEVYEVLMRAILQLPDYLEQVQTGRADDPLVLLPLLNDLRAARGANLLSENALFAPDLDAAETIEVQERTPEVDVVDLARRVRHQYQVGLLGWYRNERPQAALEQIRGILVQLERASRRAGVVALWWVANGAVEALIDGGLESSASVKLLLGQVDRAIKRLINDGEDAVADAAAPNLLTNLLYYVARATSDGARVAAVRDKFRLSGVLPSADELQDARDALAGPNQAMMQTVSSAIREDLANVKEALDLFLRADDRNLDDLRAQLEPLRKVADTVGMLGLGVARKQIQEQAGVIRSMLDGEADPSEERMMAIASALLSVESSLDGSLQSRIASAARTAPSASDQPAGDLPDAEFQQIRATAMAEVATNIAKAKDAVISFIDAPWDHALLTDVPGLLAQVRGALQMVAFDRAAELMDAIGRYVNEQLIGQQRQPDAQELDQFADALASVEYYLEATGHAGDGSARLLAVANQSLERLGYPVASPEPAPGAESDVEALAVEEIEVQPLPEETPQAEQGGEVETLPEPEPEPESASESESAADESAPDSELQLQPSEAAAEEEQQEPPPAAPGSAGDATSDGPAAAEAAAPPAPRPLMEDVDDDILGIFIEEAEEELAAIGEHLPLWRENTDDHEALGRIRRAFHTLKGSGRLVGAVDIGELAWSIENMLNRVLDHTVEATETVFGLVANAVEILPQLLRQLQGESVADIDFQTLIDRAFAVVDGSRPDPVQTEVHPPEPESIQHGEGGAGSEGPAALEMDPVLFDVKVASGDEVSEEAQPEAMDPVLYEIFRSESTGHLEEIKKFVEQCQANADHCQVSDGLVRALHTLHGSARMAGAMVIAELGGSLEKYVKALLSNEAPLPARGVDALVEGVDAIESMLDELRSDGDTPVAPRADLLERVQQLCADEQIRAERRLRGEAAQAEESETDADDVDYDTELAEIFLEEGAEILDKGEMILQRWDEDRDNMELVAELQRELHTLKGGARMAGVTAIGDLSHGMESLLSDVADGQAGVSSAAMEVLHRTMDRLFAMLERTQERRTVEPAPELIEELASLRRKPSPDADDEAAAGEPPADPPAADPAPAEAAAGESAAEETAAGEVVPFPSTPGAADAAPAVPAPEVRAEPTGVERRVASAAQEQVRVRAELLENLVNFAGEASIYRSRLEQQNSAFRYNLLELSQTVSRLREQLRKLEIETEAQILYRYEQEGELHEGFDPLEMDRYSQMQQLSRALLESVSDIASIEGLLDTLVRESETLLLQQSRVNTELQEGLMRTRMVPFTGLVPRMRRLVRQTCQELGRKAELHVVGGDGEMDRTVLDRVLAPLEHMLRNAVSHGIEAPERRQELGKPEVGNLTLSLAREGSEVVIRLADDGAGIDLDAIRAKAMERGLLDQGAELTDSDIMQFILESGFSTAEEVTQISGRGVGLDVVNSEIKQLGGSLHIDSRPREGSAFTVRLPFTLALNKALLVMSGDDTYAVPLTSIEGIVRLPRGELETYLKEQKSRYGYAGNEYEVQSLAVLLSGAGDLPAGPKVFPVLLVRSGDHRLALQVDLLMGSREIVVKSVGPQLSTVRGLSGATILGDGRVVLILDVGALTRLSVAARAAMPDYRQAAPRADRRDQVTVMVVDDSITVRKVTTRLLERNNMRVLTAKDGVDAVALLQEHIPDVVLLDIEMPRMDGFELATHMRNDSRLRHIPITMITSRSGDKHRRRAEEIGVNRYLSKPYQESDLLDTIAELVTESHRDA